MRKHSGGSGCKTNCKGDSTVNFKFEHKILVFFLFRRLQLVDWNLFWTALGAIGGTLGAIATFVAVVVALWQTKLNYKKKYNCLLLITSPLCQKVAGRHIVISALPLRI